MVNGSLEMPSLAMASTEDVFPAGPRVGRVGVPCLSEEILPAGENPSSVNPGLGFSFQRPH